MASAADVGRLVVTAGLAVVLSAACSSGPHAERSVAASASVAATATAGLKGWGAPAGLKGWGAPVLADDFNGSALNPHSWQIYNDPNAPSHPGVAAGVSVAGGQLKLVGGLYNGKDESAGIISNLALTFGRWEARIRTDPGPGYSATAFLFPTTLGAPEYAEIDFAEILDPSRREAAMFVHHGVHDQQIERGVRANFTMWHTVAMDWLPDHISFYLDGKVVWTYRGAFVPQRADMHLCLRDEVQPGFVRTPGEPRSTAMYVDWVRVYRAPGH